MVCKSALISISEIEEQPSKAQISTKKIFSGKMSFSEIFVQFAKLYNPIEPRFEALEKSIPVRF